MKKIISIITCTITALLICSCGLSKDKYIPSGYIECEEYFEKDSIQDHTDFCIYRYEDSQIIEDNTSYSKLTEEELEKITSYFSNFRDWMEAQNRLEEYTFDETSISIGDYFILQTKEGQPVGNSQYGVYDNYTVYFFDSDTCTLYYIHSNI